VKQALKVLREQPVPLETKVLRVSKVVKELKEHKEAKDFKE
jgi:hypothetical protein